MGLLDATPENIEGFVHFWAVMGYILGIKDKFNLCLLPVEVVRIVCKHFLRLFFIPQMQIETPNFKKMVGAMLKGAKKIVPLGASNVFLTLAKIYCQVPGYNKFISKEDNPNHRVIFTQSELDAVYAMTRHIQPHFPQTTKIPIITVFETAQTKEDVNESKDGIDYSYVKEMLNIEVSKIDIQYKTADEKKAFEFGSELFDAEHFLRKCLIRFMFLTKKIYRSSPFCRWILDIIFERDMQRNFGDRYIHIGEYNNNN